MSSRMKHIITARYSIWITLVAAKPSVVLPAVKSRWSSLSFCMVHLLCTEHFGDDILCLLVTKWRSLLVEIDRASSRAPWSQCVMCSSTSMHRSSPLAASSLLHKSYIAFVAIYKCHSQYSTAYSSKISS
uniref:Secreted protein n=1 Tax=Aegilops tauschii subsp. strangulata TaxID=200361 RepID=A0A453BBM3_AEGTS